MTRQRDNDEPDQQPAKIQWLELPGESVPATKIIDLYDDCLVKIFEQLDLESLFNAAIANEWLRPSAAEVYKRKFGAKIVNISKCHEENCCALQEYYGLINVSGLMACLRFLRCFGSSINILEIDYNKSKSKRYQYVLQYINNYCAESLIQFTFENMLNVMLIAQQFQKVFCNIKTVHILNSDLGQQWPSFIEWFPSVRRLDVDSVRMIHCTTIELIKKPFPHLNEIFIGAMNKFKSNKKVAASAKTIGDYHG